jgi:hypothetical protein
MRKPLLGMIVALSLCGCSLFPELYDLQAEYYSPGRVWRVDLPEFKRAVVALGAGDCRTAWNTIWPLAKAGNADAFYFLGTSIFDRMSPPGVDPWSYPRGSRHSLTLSAYAALARLRPGQGDPDHKWVRRQIPIDVKELALGTKGEQVAQCYQSGEAFQTCLDLAVSLGVVPRFEEYAEEVERAERETGRSASCRPHPDNWGAFLFRL